ncbi:MAG TPA: hypothetical protein VM012_00655 [Flavitalea sp.]|nr:hypothetical protein [Flavitalea sp.]
MALQIDITNIADHRCMIRDIELFVITKGDKYSLPLQENGNKLKNIEIRARAVVQKNLQVAFEHIEQLPVFFPNEEFNFYLSYKENRKKAETTRIQRINFIISTPEKA